MSRIDELLDFLAEKGKHPRATILEEVQRTGRRPVGCMPIYAPDEIVYAGGFLPVGLWGGDVEYELSDRFLQSFTCSIMRANIELGMRGVYDMLTAVIIPVFCDTLKCICDDWVAAVPAVPRIPIVYAQNRKTDAGKTYMAQEFNHVRTMLETIGGVAITEDSMLKAIGIYDDWADAMQEFTKAAAQHPGLVSAERRHYIIKAGFFMEKPRYTQYIREITEELQKLPESNYDGIRVVVTGVLLDAPELLKTFDETGIAIAADDLAQESRQFRVRNGTKGTALQRMAERVANRDGCSFLYDRDKQKGPRLINLVKEYQADGLIVCMLKFCEAEEFDYPIYKTECEQADIPLLYFEINQKADSAEQIRTRLQSFREMLT